MNPQVEGVAPGKAGGVWMEGSAEGTMQRYYIFVFVFICVTVLP